MNTVFCHICNQTSASKDLENLLCGLCGSEFVELRAAPKVVPQPKIAPELDTSIVDLMNQTAQLDLKASLASSRPQKSKFQCQCASEICPVVGSIYADYTEEARAAGVNLYRKIAENILKAPEEAKYRRIVTNKISTTLAKLPPLSTLLKAVGFELTAHDDPQCFTLPPTVDLARLKDGLSRIEKYEHQTKEEYEKALQRNQEVLAQNMAEIEEQNLGKSARRHMILREVEDCKKQNLARAGIASVAVPTQFGAKVLQMPKSPPPQKVARG